MILSEIRALVIDDSVYKAIDISKALEFSGIRDILRVRDQEAAFRAIYESVDANIPFKLIVTDMHYPLEKGMEPVFDAGVILIERLKREGLNIPVIICSSLNLVEPDSLGTVWYNELCDLNREFRDLVKKMVNERS